jgi:hypothetical protein
MVGHAMNGEWYNILGSIRGSIWGYMLDFAKEKWHARLVPMDFQANPMDSGKSYGFSMDSYGR